MAEHLIADESIRSNLQAAYAAQQWPHAYAILLSYSAMGCAGGMNVPLWVD
jgi:hypothetical protein